jgi:hypothetical protein
MTLTGKIRRILRETLSQCYFVLNKSNMERPGFEPGLCREEPATNRLSDGTASVMNGFQVADI